MDIKRTSLKDPIQAILFDLDNTLLDRDLGFRSFCRELYHTSDIIRASHSEEEALALMLAMDGQIDGQGLRSRQQLFTDLLDQWPGVFRDPAHALEVFSAAFPRLLHLEPETRALLEALRDAAVPFGIVTNGGTVMQAGKVRESGLHALAQVVVISEEFGCRKPDRRIFEHALSLLGAEPSITLFVGDNADDDILGAMALGMPTAWVHRGRAWPYDGQRPDYVIGRVCELRDILLRAPDPLHLTSG